MSEENYLFRWTKNKIGRITGLMIITNYASWFLLADNYELLVVGYTWEIISHTILVIIFYSSSLLMFPLIVICTANNFLLVYRMVNTSATMLVEKYNDILQIESNGELGANNGITEA